MNDDIFITIIKVGDHTYGYSWSGSRLADALRVLGRQAANPEHPLTWAHAAQFAVQMRRQLEDAQKKELDALLNRLGWPKPKAKPKKRKAKK